MDHRGPDYHYLMLGRSDPGAKGHRGLGPMKIHNLPAKHKALLDIMWEMDEDQVVILG